MSDVSPAPDPAAPIPVEGWTQALLEGLGLWLSELEVATFSVTDEAYVGTPARPPLWLSGLRSSPDVAYSVTSYPVDDSVDGADVVVGLQVISRGTTDRRTALRLDDRVYNVLHGARDLVWRGIPIVVVARRSGVSLGQDANRRHQQVSNYWATAARPSLYRLD